MTLPIIERTTQSKLKQKHLVLIWDRFHPLWRWGKFSQKVSLIWNSATRLWSLVTILVFLRMDSDYIRWSVAWFELMIDYKTSTDSKRTYFKVRRTYNISIFILQMKGSGIFLINGQKFWRRSTRETLCWWPKLWYRRNRTWENIFKIR